MASGEEQGGVGIDEAGGEVGEAVERQGPDG